MEEKEILKTGSVELVGLSILMAARSIENFFNRKLSKSGVTMSQVYALYAISEYRGKNISYIAKKLCMDRSTLTRRINLTKQYVTLYKEPSDKRNAYPGLTPEGAEFLKKWMPKLMSLEKGIGVFVSDKENFIKFIKSFSSDIVNNKIRADILDVVANEPIFDEYVR